MQLEQARQNVSALEAAVVSAEAKVDEAKLLDLGWMSRIDEVLHALVDALEDGEEVLVVPAKRDVPGIHLVDEDQAAGADDLGEPI